MYEPTDEEKCNCISGRKSCEYGMCNNCSIGTNDEEGEVENNEEEA